MRDKYFFLHMLFLIGHVVDDLLCFRLSDIKDSFGWLVDHVRFDYTPGHLPNFDRFYTSYLLRGIIFVLISSVGVVWLCNYLFMLLLGNY